MSDPKTLLQLAGAEPAPASVGESVLLLIDCQREYVDGQLRLSGIDNALREIGRLLDRYRQAEAPIVHIIHRGQAGGLFDPDGPGGQVAPEAVPTIGEPIVEKTLPNGFAGTSLEKTLQEISRKKLIVAGFMTHMCVSSTVRAGIDLGYSSTVIDAATATRDLPLPGGGVVNAETVHRSSLAALADRFAAIASTAADLPD